MVEIADDLKMSKLKRSGRSAQTRRARRDKIQTAMTSTGLRVRGSRRRFVAPRKIDELNLSLIFAVQ